MRGTPNVYFDFRDGIDLASAPYSLTEKQAKETRNVHSAPSGAVKKRYGCPGVSTELHKATEILYNSLFACNQATPCFLAAAAKKIIKITTTGTCTVLKETVSENVPWEWTKAPVVEAKGPFYGVNGTNTPQYWTGAAAETKDWTATTGSVPNGTIIGYFDNRVVIAKGSTLYASDILNPFKWASPDGWATEINPEDGGEITGFGPVGPYLMVFKERKSFLITDMETGAYRQVSGDTGCLAKRSVVPTEVGLWFLSTDGEILLTDGQSFDRQIQEPIAPVLLNTKGAIGEKVSGAHQGDAVYFSVSEEGSELDTVLEYDLTNNSWWPHKIKQKAGVEKGIVDFALLDVSKEGKLFGLVSEKLTNRKSTLVECFKINTYYDLDSTEDAQYYTAYWKSAWNPFGLPHIKKRVREIRVDAKGNYSLYTYKSFNSGVDKLEYTNWEVSEAEEAESGEGEFGGEGIYGGTVAVGERRFYTPGIGRAWSFYFLSEDMLDFEMFAYTVAIEYKKD